ncbi:Ubiquitin-specific-processing protease 8 [Hyphodiscus hymeniophilus]|uniref:Ubiquitin carboxyl-terminal hydrolase n=1 Tax=Hyphodiscus hymeniophilus TaxID=353542 RepID=A0A9P6VG49_9HELO|nr:Ubiquitin-specific-processing protease 8 [Hyphodiscus hymeniophilus]
MPPSRPQTPAEVQVKEAQQGVPRYGCPHLQQFLGPGPQNKLKETIAQYKGILGVIFDRPPLIRQTSQLTKTDDMGLVTLTPNYLCLQCTVTATERSCLPHGNETKHRLYVESRTGSVYCQMCDDFVWDPTLEDMRVRKMTTGSFSTKKRKHEDLLPDPVTDDPKFISTNTIENPCRASGIRGIYNMGATCYMNVILQCFVHNPLLRNFYLGDKHPRDECSYKNCMSCAMDDMFQQFYAEETTTGYSASNILASFWLSKRKAYEELASNKEQDAHEFFQFLTEELHEINGGGRPSRSHETPPLKKAKNGNDPGCKCVVHTTFYGKLQSTITCQNPKCGGVTTSVESFLDLSLGLEAFSKKKNLNATPLSLEKCLDEEYKNWEHCDYNCHKCDSNNAKKQLSIKTLPNVLCIQLKRFKQNNGQASKIETPVSFPLKLEMLPYTSQARSQDTRENFALVRTATYDLQSVVQHVGQLETGHYASYSRVGNQWFRFNDHNVTLASKSDVLQTEAFLLFYVIRSLA